MRVLRGKMLAFHLVSCASEWPFSQSLPRHQHSCLIMHTASLTNTGHYSVDSMVRNLLLVAICMIACLAYKDFAHTSPTVPTSYLSFVCSSPTFFYFNLHLHPPEKSFQATVLNIQSSECLTTTAPSRSSKPRSSVNIVSLEFRSRSFKSLLSLTPSCLRSMTNATQSGPER